MFWLIIAPIFIIGVFVGIMMLINYFSKSPQRSNTKVRIDDFEGAKKVGITIMGIFIGGMLGFIIRPSAPIVGQLPFEQVITQGSNLKGMDTILVSVAQSSFNYLLFGAIIGGIVGGSVAYFVYQQKNNLNISKPDSQVNVNQPAEVTSIRHGKDVTERIKELSDLKESGILTEDEFQAKKIELLSRL